MPTPHQHQGDGRRLDGLDVAAVERYLATEHPHLHSGRFVAEPIAGGRSNLTYGLTDGQHSWVLRRPPTRHVLATAHDMAREHRVMSALHGSAVPVPGMVLLCPDPTVIGAPFYVMERIVGTAYRDAAQLAPLGPSAARGISERMVDVLAALHRVEPAAVGLEGFGRPEGFLARQVKRWGRQLADSRTRELAHAIELQEALEAGVPESPSGAIVHGDFRLDNLLVDSRAEVTAVLDWEMATLGDPLTDLALLTVYQEVAGWATGSVLADASNADGYLAPGQIRARYFDRTGLEATSMPFHMALGYFKLAVILEGIVCRGAASGPLSGDVMTLARMVEPLCEAGRDALVATS